jgi:hypothetical protein
MLEFAQGAEDGQDPPFINPLMHPILKVSKTAIIYAFVLISA